MPLDFVSFNAKWYDDLIAKTNEKYVLLDAFRQIISDESESCLEIGLGTSSFVLDHLGNHFKQYDIGEKEELQVNLPSHARLVLGDWESVNLKQKYDVIIASHVVYYFKDRATAIQKMMDALTDNGIAIIVVNGKDADYGPMKLAFSQLVGTDYKFTYDEIKDILANYNCVEYSTPSSLNFQVPSELFETLKLSFDQYPVEYEQHKQAMIQFFEERCQNKDKFVINQKVFVCRKKNIPL